MAESGQTVQVVVSEAGRLIMRDELGVNDEAVFFSEMAAETGGQIRVWDNHDFTAPFISGSSAADGVIIAPCSAGKLAAIAAGLASNVMERAADVALKERKPLILMFRETPLNLIHIDNMAQLTKAGAIIAPAAPGFYNNNPGPPQRVKREIVVQDLVDFMTGKILNLLGIGQTLLKPWGENQ
jgi:4-hydroxy-3-polyprenylbenzoate decarboxylase